MLWIKKSQQPIIGTSTTDVKNDLGKIISLFLNIEFILLYDLIILYNDKKSIKINVIIFIIATTFIIFISLLIG